MEITNSLEHLGFVSFAWDTPCFCEFFIFFLQFYTIQLLTPKKGYFFALPFEDISITF
jgi:hypothetical protein